MISKVVYKNEKSFIGPLIRSKLLKSVHKTYKYVVKKSTCTTIIIICYTYVVHQLIRI